jgi:hypothetical protein
MLTPETPYPYPGSYALFIDRDLPESQQHEELVRIMWRRADDDGSWVAVSFPQRAGASGTKVVPAGELIDATPLSGPEAVEFHNLDRHLFGRTSFRSKRLKAMKARRETLHSRAVWAPHMARLLRQVRASADQRWAA